MENPFEIIIDKLNRIETLLNSFTSGEKNVVQTPEIFTIDEAAKYVYMAKSTLYKMTAGRNIPHFKRGRKVYFRKSELDEWLTKNKITTMEEIDQRANDYILKKRNRNR